MGDNLLNGVILATVGVLTVGAAYVGYKAFAQKDEGPGTEPNDCVEDPAPLKRIVIDFVDPQMQPNTGDRGWVFKAAYRNPTCIQQVISIFMQVKAENNRDVALQVRDMILEPGESKGFDWRFLFLPDDRILGGNKIKFFVWRSPVNAAALSEVVSVTI